MGLFDDEDNGTSFLANIQKEQRRLGNLTDDSKVNCDKTSATRPTSHVSKPKSFAAGMDEDDDDLFAEFDVDLDMDKETSVPPKAASSPPTSSATDDAAPHDTLMNDASVEVAQAAAEPALDMSSAEATKDDHNYTDAGAAPETGPTLPDAPSALDQSTRQDIGQDASPGIWPLTTGTACTEDLGPASKVDGQDADKSPASMQNSQNSAEQAAISTPGLHSGQHSDLPTGPLVPEAMCGLTSAASSAQQDEDSTEDMQIVTGLQQSAQPWPASQVPLQEEAGQSPAAVPIITTPRASGTPKTNALTDTDMRESPTVPTQVERTPKIRTQAVDAPAALASTQPPTAAPALVQSPTLTRPHQPESHHPSVKASKGQPDAIARSASPLKNCAEQAVLEHNAAKQLLPDKADTDHPLMAAAQPQMPTKAPRPRTIQTKAGLPEVVDAPFEVAEQATTVHLHESLKQAETSDKPDTALHNWSNGKMGNGVPAKTSQEPRKPCQLNAKPASGAPLCAPSVQAEFQLDAVGLNSKAGQTAAARPLSKPADLAVTSKHPRTEGSRGHAVLLSRRTSSGLQPPSGSPKASLSFQLNFNTKAKPLLFAKSKLAAQPGQTTTSGQADMQRTQLLSSLKNISGGAGKSSAPSSLPFRFGTAPVSNGSKAPSQVTHTSPAPALPPQDRSQAENRPLTATAAAQHGVPHVTASTHDNLLAKQASSMTTHPMSKDITPTSPNLPNAVFSPPESSQLVSRATAKQSQKRQTEELPHVRSDSQNRAGGQDLPQGENAGGADQARTPWTTTSLAGDLMQNMKHLEAMMLEIERMHDEVLECRVDVAISSNRLTRLDNPIVHDKLRALRREADEAMQGCEE